MSNISKPSHKLTQCLYVFQTPTLIHSNFSQAIVCTTEGVFLFVNPVSLHHKSMRVKVNILLPCGYWDRVPLLFVSSFVLFCVLVSLKICMAWCCTSFFCWDSPASEVLLWQNFTSDTTVVASIMASTTAMPRARCVLQSVQSVWSSYWTLVGGSCWGGCISGEFMS